MIKKIISKITLEEINLIPYKFLFWLIFYSSSLVLYLTFDIAQTPDFEKYYKYFEYYSGEIDKSFLDQGNLYFFLNYFRYTLFTVFLTH